MTDVDFRLPSRSPTVQAPKVAELVADSLRRSIISGDLADGAELPREFDLLEKFGVSRPSLREALRILETEGLLQVRRGRDGGALVRRPTPASAAYHLGLTLQARAVTLGDIALARQWIEPLCTELVAALPERAAIVEELTRLVDESEQSTTVREFTEDAHIFHRRLTELSGNQTIVVLTGVLVALWNSQETYLAAAQVHTGTPNTHEALGARSRSIAAHRRLIELIDAGDARAASDEMRRHLVEMSAMLTQALGPEAPLQVVPSPA